MWTRAVANRIQSSISQFVENVYLDLFAKYLEKFHEICLLSNRQCIYSFHSCCSVHFQPTSRCEFLLSVKIIAILLHKLSADFITIKCLFILLLFTSIRCSYSTHLPSPPNCSTVEPLFVDLRTFQPKSHSITLVEKKSAAGIKINTNIVTLQ